MIQAQPSIDFHSIDCEPLPAVVNISRFQGRSGVEECHVMVRPTTYGSINTQMEWVLGAYKRALASAGLGDGTCVFRRFFCSDLPNQASALETYPFANPRNPDEPCAVSWVCQPPASPTKVALWAYHVSDPDGALDKSKHGESLSLRRGDLSHIWTTGVTCADSDTSYGQTEGILDRYDSDLQSRGLCLADHVIRTWFFVRDVDANYQGLVDARREVFAKRGLTPDTHFIASTGIEGASADVAANVTMDAYAISGVRGEQIEFLSAPDHLSPTYTYGVTFERGVSVSYRDRKHVTISGTASIDRNGEIVYPGDVVRQLDHTLENVEALLQQADAMFQDVSAFIVYVRDPSDLGVAQRVMRERFGAAPVQVVVAPVCRPGWLVEVECQAIVHTRCPALPVF
jgi:enamine deaminase RidA (YjgF/YER057c/UK114 family)